MEQVLKSGKAHAAAQRQRASRKQVKGNHALPLKTTREGRQRVLRLEEWERRLQAREEDMATQQEWIRQLQATADQVPALRAELEESAALQRQQGEAHAAELQTVQDALAAKTDEFDQAMRHIRELEGRLDRQQAAMQAQSRDEQVEERSRQLAVKLDRTQKRVQTLALQVNTYKTQANDARSTLNQERERNSEAEEQLLIKVEQAEAAKGAATQAQTEANSARDMCYAKLQRARDKIVRMKESLAQAQATESRFTREMQAEERQRSKEIVHLKETIQKLAKDQHARGMAPTAPGHTVYQSEGEDEDEDEDGNEDEDEDEDDQDEYEDADEAEQAVVEPRRKSRRRHHRSSKKRARRR